MGVASHAGCPATGEFLPSLLFCSNQPLRVSRSHPYPGGHGIQSSYKTKIRRSRDHTGTTTPTFGGAEEIPTGESGLRKGFTINESV